MSLIDVLKLAGRTSDGLIYDPGPRFQSYLWNVIASIVYWYDASLLQKKNENFGHVLRRCDWSPSDYTRDKSSLLPTTSAS